LLFVRSAVVRRRDRVLLYFAGAVFDVVLRRLRRCAFDGGNLVQSGCAAAYLKTFIAVSKQPKQVAGHISYLLIRQSRNEGFRRAPETEESDALRFRAVGEQVNVRICLGRFLGGYGEL
jgi:hypothetical protein